MSFSSEPSRNMPHVLTVLNPLYGDEDTFPEGFPHVVILEQQTRTGCLTKEQRGLSRFLAWLSR